MGGGASTQHMQTQDQTKAHSAQCFAVACMDFRLVDDTVRFMDSIGLNNNYDEFVLAGASLGFTQEKYPSWGQACLDHMSIGMSLHNFRKFYPDINHQNEEEYHRKHMQMAHDKLAAIFPNFKFRGYLMDIEGKTIEIPVKSTPKIDPSKVKEDVFLAELHH